MSGNNKTITMCSICSNISNIKITKSVVYMNGKSLFTGVREKSIIKTSFLKVQTLH